MRPEISAHFRSKLRDYCSLTKPEVNLLVLMTTSAGYYVAGGPLRIIGLIHTLIGTLLVASGTATLNQWMERFWDGQMRRTSGRPLPSGRLHSREAFLFGILLSISGGLYLAWKVNWPAAALAIATLLSYLLVYTPLKRKTPLCTLIGAIPGAMPVLIGSAGASSSIGEQAWFLFAIVFLWQFPHFLAIALMYREDYARAGYKMLPEFDRDCRFTRAEILTLTLILIFISMLVPGGSGSALYLCGALLAGCFFFYYVVKLARSASQVLASHVLHASVLYLPIILGMIIALKR